MRQSAGEGSPTGADLNDREREILEAVVRCYVESAEPTGSQAIVRRFNLALSPATVRNTMADLEAKGYLFHPHTSAGRVPTDLAYRFFVDRVVRPRGPSPIEMETIREELDLAGPAAIERLIGRATRALSLLSHELGLAVTPNVQDAVLEKLELVKLSSSKLLLVATVRSGVVRTIFVDLRGEVPQDTLVAVTSILNERLGGLMLSEIRDSLPERLRDVPTGEDDASATELINIFMQSSEDLFGLPLAGEDGVHIGQTSILATQPEFTSGERLKGILELTERRDFLADVLGRREHSQGLRITIGAEHSDEELSELTLVTAEYRFGHLKGVIGVIGPTRMPYEKVISVVQYTSSLVDEMFGT
jgi:heat-inducible transcriptional repressor